MSKTLAPVLERLQADFDDAVTRLTELLRIPSISTDPAYRPQTRAAAEAQFAQLSGVSDPRLKELLADPSGELLALACRAAGLDRLTFAALYLLQGQGRTVADPKIVAGAVGLFEKTGPAEAQRLLAERRVGDSLSA